MNFTAAILCAVAASTVMATFLGVAGGALTVPIASASLATGALIAAVGFWSGRNQPWRLRALTFWEGAAIAVFALFSLRAFLWLIFHDGDAMRVLSPNNLGDMSLHLTYIRHLASGAPFWPENPIHSGATTLTYPLGMDLFNALLALLGIDVVRGLIWVGLAGCVLTAVALWRWGGAFVIAGFLCNGGVMGFALFSEGKLADYQADVAWKSIPLALFVTQRGLLFALPAGLLLLASWRERFFNVAAASLPQFNSSLRQDAAAALLPFWAEVLLYASMPLFHLHTFLFLSFVLAAWFAIHGPARKSLAALVGASLIPASAFVLLVTASFQGPSMIGWKPGWMQGEQNPLVFWLVNFGALPVFVAALCTVLLRESQEPWPAAIVFPALAVFLLCCFVKFAPWEWDNTKLMIWSYLAVLPFLWTHLLAHWPASARAISCVILFFSGFVSLLGGLNAAHRGYDIALRSELDGVAAAVRGLPLAERFAGAPTYNHPLLLNGRKMAMGYEGHLSSHGYEDWAERKARVAALMNGAEDWSAAAAALDVRYLFWGREERDQFPDSTQPWRATARLIASGEWGELFDLTEAGESTPASLPQ